MIRPIVALLLGAMVLASACGLKGDPIRPGSKEDLERRQEEQKPPAQGG